MNSISARAYQPDADFWRVRQLLIDTYLTTGPGFNWELRRWDGQRFHQEDERRLAGMMPTAQIWSNSAGQVIGAAHSEGIGANFYLQIHPDYRSQIEDEMIVWAVDHIATRDERGEFRLETFAFEHDSPRIRLLEKHGFRRMDGFGVMRHLRIGNQALPDAALAKGYTMRETCAHPDDYQSMADLLNAAFSRSIHTAREYQNFVTYSPSFRHDLNLIAEAPDGTFAAHVGVTFVPEAGYGVFEPVCTHPEHRRKGLAQALMFAGLHRLRTLGALHVHVDTGSMEEANAFYETIGFTEAYRGWYWGLHQQP